MTSKDFFEEVKYEWCASEQQSKPLLNDMMKFAKLYHKEQLKSAKVISGSFTDSDIGQEFEIVGNSNEHEFEIGEVVTLSDLLLSDEGDEGRFEGKEDYWFCVFKDVRRL
jgi:hypothetical protein